MATATALQLELPAGAEVVTPPPTSTDPTLCVVCGVGKRAGSGVLTRCIACIKIAAQRARDARAAAEAIVAARSKAEQPTKTCRSCRKAKPVSDFAAHRVAKDGKRRDCRRCVSTGRSQVKPKTPEQLAKDRDRAKRPERKARNLEAVHKWQATNRDALMAHKAVAAAVKEGRLAPARTCQVQGCKRRKRLHAHHSSYHPKRRLVVSWLCAAHHKATHNGLTLKLKAGAGVSVARAPKAA